MEGSNSKTQSASIPQVGTAVTQRNSLEKGPNISGPQVGESSTSSAPPPPMYEQDAWELDTLDGLDDLILEEIAKPKPPSVARVDDAPVTGPRPLGPEELPYSFFKPREVNLKKSIMWFGLAALLVILASIGTAVGIVQGTQHHHEATPQNDTIIISSTQTTTHSTTSLTTFSTTQSTTSVTTQPTTKTEETTLIQSTTTIQTTTMDHSTSLLELTTETTTQSATTTLNQLTTQTTTQSPDPTGFANTCWDIKKSICSGTMTVPPDRQSNGFGECKQMLTHFYCGMIVEFENYGLIVVPIEASPLCAGMRDFCKEVEPGIY